MLKHTADKANYFESFITYQHLKISRQWKFLITIYGVTQLKLIGGFTNIVKSVPRAESENINMQFPLNMQNAEFGESIFYALM